MEPLNEANGYSSKNAYKGKLVFGLYGKACPKVRGNDEIYPPLDRAFFSLEGDFFRRFLF